MNQNATPAKAAKILVVDDDIRLRQLLERYLGEQGFTVKAVDGAAAMDRALSRELYDLVVLDLASGQDVAVYPETPADSAQFTR